MIFVMLGCIIFAQMVDRCLVRSLPSIMIIGRWCLKSHTFGIVLYFPLIFSVHGLGALSSHGVDNYRKSGSVNLDIFELSGLTLCNFQIS